MAAPPSPQTALLDPISAVITSLEKKNGRWSVTLFGHVVSGKPPPLLSRASFIYTPTHTHTQPPSTPHRNLSSSI